MRTVVLATATTLAVLTATGGAYAGSARPTIVATPDNVMVNTSVELAGSNFSPDASFELAECGAPVWKDTTDPCNTTGVPVVTDAHGSFDTSFVMTLCPRTRWNSGLPITAEKCWIGLAQSVGSTRTGLAGRVRVVVSYP